MRVESERPTRRGEGRIHVLEEVPQERTPTYQTFESVTDANRADPKTLDKVYRTLTSQLHLDRPHRANPMARGLNETEILTLGYVSLPDGLRRLPAIKSCIDLYGEKLSRYSSRVEIESLKDNLQRNAARSIRIERIKAEHIPVENSENRGEDPISPKG